MGGANLLGRVLGGHYRLEEPLGEGATGTVFRARHTLLEQDFAVKVLRPELVGDEELRQRFLREARSLSMFTHRHAVQVRHCGEEEGLLYLAMEFCPGEPLSELLAREGRIEMRRAAGLVLQVLDALGEAHAAGIVHRDLKPANVIVADDLVKVVDFGLARLLGPAAVPGPQADLTVVGGVVGTIAYMAPEQLRAGEVDGRADLFAVGAVLYEMVSGRRPFGEGSAITIMRRVLEEPPAELSRDPGTAAAPELEPFLRRALEKDPARRFQTAPGMADELRAIAGLGPEPASVRKRRLRRRITIAGALIAALAIAGVVPLLLRRARLDTLHADAHSALLGARFEEAIRLYSDLIREGAAGPQEFLGRARARAELHRADAADDLRRARDLLPRDPRVRVLEGRFAWRVAGDFARARSAFEAALRLDAGHVPARVERIRMLFGEPEADNRARIEAELNALERHAPRDGRAEALRAAAVLYRVGAEVNEKRFNDALYHAEEARRLDPRLAAAAWQHAQILMRYAGWHLGYSRYENARRLARQAFEPASAAIRLARDHPEYRTQGRLLPDCLDLRVDLRIFLLEFEAALDDLRLAVALNPTDPVSLARCALRYSQVGAYEEAIRIYERLLDISAGNAQGLFRIGFGLQETATDQARRGQEAEAHRGYERALEFYARGLEIAPADPELNTYTAETCVLLARFEEPRSPRRAELLERARRRFEATAPDHVDRYRRSIYFLETGRPDRALKDIEAEGAKGVIMTPRMHAQRVACLLAVARERPPERARELALEALRSCGTIRTRDPGLSATASWVLEGDVLRQLADYETEDAVRRERRAQAVRAYRSAIAAGVQQAVWRIRAHMAAADVLVELERFEEAVEEARRGLELGRAEAEAGRWFRVDENRAHLDRVLEAAGRPAERH